MTNAWVERIKKQMEAKTNEELIQIWTENDHERWTGDAFEAIREILTSRGIPLPEQGVPPHVQREHDVAAQLRQLVPMPLKTATRLERAFAVWSFLLGIWLVFGFFNILYCFRESQQFGRLVDTIHMVLSPSPFFTVELEPETAEAVARLSPHIVPLERVKGYALIAAIVSIPAWIAYFPIRKGFVLRKRWGPLFFLILLFIVFVVNAYGAVVSTPIPAEVADLIHLAALRAQPFATAIVAFTLVPLLRKRASTFYSYTAVDAGCFGKDGVGLQVLNEKVGETE